MTRKEYIIKLKNSELLLGRRTLIMGILNVTPDSFSDGGKFIERASAVEHALHMAEEGADIIDIGGESSRPGALAVPEDEEIARVLPVIEGIREYSQLPISIDTCRSQTASAAIKAGADIINDISACRFDAEMPRIAAEHNAPVILMHMKGTPKTMQNDPHYDDLFGEIMEYLSSSIATLEKAGLARSQTIIDPGIGFGKSYEDNLEIMRKLDKFTELDRPILVGVSRKSVVGKTLDLPPEKRVFGTSAAVTANIMMGAHIVRVHDVAEMKQVAIMADAIL